MSQLSWNDLETKTLRHEQQIAQLNAALEMMRQLTLQTGVVVNSVVPVEVIAKKELDHLRSKAKAGGEAMDAIDAVLLGQKAIVPGLYLEGMLKTDAIKLLGAKYNELRAEVNALHVDLSRTNGALGATNTDLNNAKSHVERLQKELANANDALDASADRARARMNELESARGQINMLNNDRLELAGRLKAAEDRYARLTNDYDRLTANRDAWQKIVNRAELEVCGHCTIAPPSGSMLVQKVIELKSKLQGATHALESAHQSIVNLSQEIVELKAEANARKAMQ